MKLSKLVQKFKILQLLAKAKKDIKSRHISGPVQCVMWAILAIVALWHGAYFYVLVCSILAAATYIWSKQ